jgi:hypothetical protein
MEEDIFPMRLVKANLSSPQQAFGFLAFKEQR